jgi:hypothetical protein
MICLRVQLVQAITTPRLKQTIILEKMWFFLVFSQMFLFKNIDAAKPGDLYMCADDIKDLPLATGSLIDEIVLLVKTLMIFHCF